jgi:ABC-type branched-subunit amino acid transport system substrate-binding protein
MPVLAAMALAVALAGCQSLGGGGLSAPAPVQPTAEAAPATAGEVIGTGGVRVALLVPRSGGGNGAASATAFRNAAELALRDFPAAGIQVAVYDTKGDSAGAQAAAGTALAEGAELILGPVFSGEVSAVATQARQAGVPLLAFSSDAAVAGPGVYLLSFLPADDVERIVSYAASQGRKSFAALLPANAYGSVAEASFRRAVAASGGRIVAIESYGSDPADIEAKAAAIVRIGAQVDALLVPEGGDSAISIATALSAGGVTRERTKILGSGQWDNPQILGNAALVGSWYPAPVKQGFDEFSRKYQAAFGASPPRNATLAYDGTVLAAGLVRQYGAERFTPGVLTNRNGFAGVDGIFRFTAGGLTERRLAVYEVTGSGARIIGPAARNFAAGS